MPHTRQQVIDGLRELAQFLEDHPDLPCDKHPRLTVFPGTDTPTEGEDARRSEVDAAAAILAIRPALSRAGHYFASRQFAGVEYRICHIPDGEITPCGAPSPEGDHVCPGAAGHDDNHVALGPGGEILRVWAQAEPEPQAAPEVPFCGRCMNAPVHRPGGVRADGKPLDTAQFCWDCIDRCHESTDFAHICVICASAEEIKAGAV